MLSEKEASNPRAPWKPMALRHVGDVGLVMSRKSGRRRDPSFNHRKKRGGGGHDDD